MKGHYHEYDIFLEFISPNHFPTEEEIKKHLIELLALSGGEFRDRYEWRRSEEIEEK